MKHFCDTDEFKAKLVEIFHLALTELRKTPMNLSYSIAIPKTSPLYEAASYLVELVGHMGLEALEQVYSETLNWHTFDGYALLYKTPFAHFCPELPQPDKECVTINVVGTHKGWVILQPYFPSHYPS